MVKLYWELIKCFMKDHYIMSSPLSQIDPEDRNQHRLTSQMYLHIFTEIRRPDNQANQDSLNYFHAKCQEFLTCACKQIKQLYNVGNPILEILKPNHLPGGTEGVQVPSLMPVLSLLPRVCSKEKYQEVDDEWRRLSFYPLGQVCGTWKSTFFRENYRY